MNEFELGSYVTCIYKTGKYIGEITDVKPAHYLVRVLGVMQHPTQGDLHNPKQTDVPIFHERRALAYREQANIPKSHVKSYEGEIPSYSDSLKKAVEDAITELQADDSKWATQCIENLRTLQADYFKGAI